MLDKQNDVLIFNPKTTWKTQKLITVKSYVPIHDTHMHTQIHIFKICTN